MSNLWRRLKLRYYEWVYRDVEDDICCCGDWMENHAYENHSAKSLKEWAIERAMS